MIRPRILANCVYTNEQNDTTIDYEGQETSLSASALFAIKKCGYDWSSVQGPAYWLYEGETLQWHRRNNEYMEP